MRCLGAVADDDGTEAGVEDREEGHGRRDEPPEAEQDEAQPIDDERGENEANGDDGHLTGGDCTRVERDRPPEFWCW